jgi:hypothetical protein
MQKLKKISNTKKTFKVISESPELTFMAFFIAIYVLLQQNLNLTSVHKKKRERYI